MKKWIILILLCLFTTGCYDYVELNDLAIVTMIVIDKDKDDYKLTFEIINDSKMNNNNMVNKCDYITGDDKMLIKAIEDISNKYSKQLYPAHLKILAITKKIAKDDLKEVIDYFLRSPQIRNEFNLVILDNDTDNYDNTNIPILGEYISSMLKNDKQFNDVTNNNFEDIIIDILNPNKDAIIPTIRLNKDNVEILGNAIFNGYKFKTILDKNDSMLLNLLNNNFNSILFTFNCPNNNGNIALLIYSSQTKYNYKDDFVNINSNLKAEIKEYECQEDLKDPETFKIFNDYYNNLFKTNISKLYHKLNNNNSNSLGINKDYLNNNVNIKVDLKINKEGLIYGKRNN